VNFGDDHEHWMRLALAQAKKARKLDEVPVGAVIVQAGKLVATGFNRPIGTCDPTAHAEIQAIRSASQALQNYRLPQCTLYVTIEPCAMCVGAIIHARIEGVVFGALEPKAGMVESQQKLLGAEHFNHGVAVLGGVLAKECGALMQEFFQTKRLAK
jgi:tRNA(Arg) A34 adenosine deaminase TadA